MDMEMVHCLRSLGIKLCSYKCGKLMFLFLMNILKRVKYNVQNPPLLWEVLSLIVIV